ncbi:berberine bridge enzyme-like 18 [Salvia hispanica]|uniref:berberine bridge enzyme-like 18 n=1 Tax=Salvia hispanica TaxID=49212 RepID=UPI002008FA6F|nr:berberine bridge enzyme-like 18 [Salvia hispanica]
MKSLTISLSFIFIIISTCSLAAYANERDDFLQCLSLETRNSSISNVVYTTNNTSYTSVLQSSIQNRRFASESTPKPHVIITPQHESQIPPIISCARQSGLEIRIRSGGHDYEGLSYVSQVPFAVIDLINFSEVTVNAEEKTAWVESGATIGTLYYRIAEKCPVLGFPAGLCPTVGVGGQFSGGGYGMMVRKFGIAADHVIDARIIDANGRILDRKSMGEDLFWAIRGGGGANFGVIISWKVQLVDVPEKVTVFTVDRTLEQNATQLFHRWQNVAPLINRDLGIGLYLYPLNSTVQATFFSLFLGGVERLLPMMQENFPELGLVREDCSEVSWIESALFFAQITGSSPDNQDPLRALLNRTQNNVRHFKTKSDFVQKPIPVFGIEGIVRLLLEPEASEGLVFMIPYGGRMSEISESETPFPHRKGNLYILASTVYWDDGDVAERYMSWSRRYYSYMAPYVSRSPRAAYLNYRDLDIGVNNPNGKTGYAQASVWGKKYFKGNFDRLVRVKTEVDPENFFRNEQSIPALYFK